VGGSFGARRLAMQLRKWSRVAGVGSFSQPRTDLGTKNAVVSGQLNYRTWGHVYHAGELYSSEWHPAILNGFG